MYLQLNANTASVQSHLGYGTIGLLYLTVTPAIFDTLSLTPFIPPANPGPEPTVPAGVIGPVISDIRLQFTNATRLHKQYNATNKALKQLLLGAVDDMFVCSLRNRHIVYANVTTLKLLTRLYTVYAKISAANLEANTSRMKIPYNVNLLIEPFFDQIEDAVEFVSAGNAPVIPVQVVNTAYNVIFQQACLTMIAKYRRENRQQKKFGQVSKLTLQVRMRSS